MALVYCGFQPKFHAAKNEEGKNKSSPEKTTHVEAWFFGRCSVFAPLLPCVWACEPLRRPSKRFSSLSRRGYAKLTAEQQAELEEKNRREKEERVAKGLLDVTLSAPHETFMQAESVKLVTVPASAGRMGILAKHVPTIAPLSPRSGLHQNNGWGSHQTLLLSAVDVRPYLKIPHVPL